VKSLKAEYKVVNYKKVDRVDRDKNKVVPNGSEKK